MAGASAFIRTAGLGRLFNALSSLVEAAEAEQDWWVGTIVTYSCVPGRTRIVTEDGSKQASAIERGDRLLTQAGVCKPVKRVFRYEIEQGTPMVRLRSRWREGAEHELELTANHKVMVYRGGRNKWVEARDVRETDALYHRRKVGPWEGTATVKTCRNCGTEFTASQADDLLTGYGRTYCTVRCRDEYWAEHPDEHPHVGATRSKEARSRMREAALKRLAEHPELHPNRIMARRGTGSKREEQLADFLDLLGVEYERQAKVGDRYVDFAVPGRRLVIEADGAYWHQDQAKDVERDRQLLDALPSGWEVVHVHFWSDRFSPELDREPIPGSHYVAVNPGPATFVDPQTFEATPVLSVERFEWRRGHKRAPKTRPVYDFEVEGVHSYYANGVLVSNSHLEFGTFKMTARPYFQPSILRVGRRLDIARARTTGDRRSGRSLWALMVDPEEEAKRISGQSPLVQRIALQLEREVKKVIREKGLIDTGHLRASITAAPSLPRMKRESFNAMSATATSRRTGRSVPRSEVVDRRS